MTKKSKTLYIFDFDGTLFKSPEPNPSIWNSSVIGKIKSMPEECGGFGWFQETITLDDPYVPSIPDRDTWFNTKVLDDALNALKDNNNVVCLLTGRTVLYQDIIDRILKSVELDFHHKGLKPLNIANVAREPTFDFKKKFILNLINETYKNQIDRVVVYEDRINHVDLFNSFLSTIRSISSYDVIHVNEEPKYLQHELELELVDFLVTKNTKPKAELKKTVDYTGLVLDKESVDKILSLVEIPKGWLVKAHHITLNLGQINHKLWKPIDETNVLLDKIQNLSISSTSSTTTANGETTTTESIVISTTTETTTTTATTTNDFEKLYTVGSKWNAKIEAIGFSPNALAVKVTGIPTANAIPHCTVAIHPNAKASDSNQIRNWYPIDKLKPGEKLTLNSHDERELTSYKDLIEKQDLFRTESPAKGNNPNAGKGGKKSSNHHAPPKEPCTCNITLPINHNETDLLSLTGTITECGKLSYEISKPAVKKEKIAVFPIIQKAIPELSKADIVKIVPKVTEWINTSNTTDIALIEEYIKTNFNDFK